jgi:hypothetical protein
MDENVAAIFRATMPLFAHPSNHQLGFSISATFQQLDRGLNLLTTESFCCGGDC